MNTLSLSEQLTTFLTQSGANLVGFADIRPLPSGVRHNLPHAVSIVHALAPEVVAGITQGPSEQYGPTLEYQNEYQRANRVLTELADKGADWLEQKGYRAVPLPPTVDKVDENSLFTPLPHKTIATRAGLGWIGKTALLINKQYGSAFRLSSILTDAPLDLGRPQTESLCGKCTACVDACPVGAASGKNWQADMNREDFFDAVACYHNAKNLGHTIENSTGSVICGICIPVCPHTRKHLYPAKNH